MLNDPVTMIITRVPKLGCEEEWESLINGLLRAAKAFPGNLGGIILRPNRDGERAYRILVRFDSLDHMRRWEESTQRRELLRELEMVECEPVQIEQAVGLEAWFDSRSSANEPKAMIPPPRYKMTIASAIGVYVTITPLLAAFGPYLHDWPIYVQTMLLVPVVVTLLTYAIMPFITKLLRAWLYQNLEGI